MEKNLSIEENAKYWMKSEDWLNTKKYGALASDLKKWITCC